MTTNNKAVQNAGARKALDKTMSGNLVKALERFEVKVFLDWSNCEARNVFYVELISKFSGERVTFVKSYFEAQGSEKKILDKLNLIGSANGHILDALIEHIDDLLVNKEFTKGGFTASCTKLSERDQQKALKNGRLVVRNYLLNEVQFACQSERDYDSYKHFGVILDQEKGLPEGTIAVGFQGEALQAVLNPLGRTQSQQYRREVLGGLIHIGMLDAKITEYADEGEDDEVIKEEHEVEDYFDGYPIINGKVVKDQGRQEKRIEQRKRVDRA